MVTDRLVRARYQPIVMAREKQELSPQERQVRQPGNQGAGRPRRAAPSCRLLIEDLGDDHADHLVQTRIGAIGDDTRYGRARRQQKRDGRAHRKSVDKDLSAPGFRLAGRDMHCSQQVVDLRVAARGRDQ